MKPKYKKEEDEERRCLCWVLLRCDWWNPTEEMLLKLFEEGKVLDKDKNPCIRCWKFKKEEK